MVIVALTLAFEMLMNFLAKCWSERYILFYYATQLISILPYKKFYSQCHECMQDDNAHHRFNCYLDDVKSSKDFSTTIFRSVVFVKVKVPLNWATETKKCLFSFDFSVLGFYATNIRFFHRLEWLVVNDVYTISFRCRYSSIWR